MFRNLLQAARGWSEGCMDDFGVLRATTDQYMMSACNGRYQCSPVMLQNCLRAMVDAWLFVVAASPLLHLVSCLPSSLLACSIVSVLACLLASSVCLLVCLLACLLAGTLANCFCLFIWSCYFCGSGFPPRSALWPCLLTSNNIPLRCPCVWTCSQCGAQ